MRTASKVTAAAAWIAIAGPASAAIHVVDCIEGPFFEISDAVAVAEPGDTVAVHICNERPYGAFRVADKQGVHIVASRIDERQAVISSDDGSINCVEIENSSDVSIGRFRFTGCPFHAIQVTSSTNVTIWGNQIFNAGVETIRDQGSVGTRILNNLIIGGIHALFLDGSDALVFGNILQNGSGDGIDITGDRSFIAENTITGNAGNGILDQGDGTRIERNTVTGNREIAGAGEIRINPGAVGTQVIGNFVLDEIVDFGEGTELVDNR